MATEPYAAVFKPGTGADPNQVQAPVTLPFAQAADYLQSIANAFEGSSTGKAQQQSGGLVATDPNYMTHGLFGEVANSGLIPSLDIGALFGGMPTSQQMLWLGGGVAALTLLLVIHKNNPVPIRVRR